MAESCCAMENAAGRRVSAGSHSGQTTVTADRKPPELFAWPRIHTKVAAQLATPGSPRTTGQESESAVFFLERESCPNESRISIVAPGSDIG